MGDRNPTSAMLAGLLVASAGVFVWAGATGKFDSGVKPVTTRKAADVRVGECVREWRTDEPIDELDLVPCNESHFAELFDAGELNPSAKREYPGDAQVHAEVIDSCEAEFPTYVGRDLGESFFDLSYFFPPEGNWAVGHGHYLCWLYNPSGDSLGSAYHSDR